MTVIWSSTKRSIFPPEVLIEKQRSPQLNSLMRILKGLGTTLSQKIPIYPIRIDKKFTIIGWESRNFRDSTCMVDKNPNFNSINWMHQPISKLFRILLTHSCQGSIKTVLKLRLRDQHRNTSERRSSKAFKSYTAWRLLSQSLRTLLKSLWQNNNHLRVSTNSISKATPNTKTPQYRHQEEFSRTSMSQAQAYSSHQIQTSNT